MENSFPFMGMRLPITERPGKGKGEIKLPKDYCMIDVETTGLSPQWDDIIEVGAIRYHEGQEIERFQSLLQPPIDDDGVYVSSFIEKLTGITNEMLATAPTASEVLPRLLEFLGDSTLLGYNVSFDVNFLYDNCLRYMGRIFENDYVDVRRLARKICPNLPRYRLKDMAAHYGVTGWTAHRTIADCEVTDQVYRKLCVDGLERFGSEQAIISSFYTHGGKNAGVRLSDIVADESKLSPDCPIYQRHCVITGKLERFTRAEAMQLIADLGGINDSTVTKNTNYLILGNNDYCTTIKDGKSSKQKKAEAMKLDGQDIDIIPETVFYDMIADYVSESLPSIPEDTENTVFEHLAAVIRSVRPNTEISLENRSSNYASLIVDGNDLIRFKYTDRAKWVSLDAWYFDLKDDDPRFAAQSNKNQRHWKAALNDIDSLSQFDDLIAHGLK